MAERTPEEREAILQNNVNNLKRTFVTMRRDILYSEMLGPLYVPGVGTLRLTPTSASGHNRADQDIQSALWLEQRLVDVFNRNRVIQLDAHSGVNLGIDAFYDSYIGIRTRDAFRRILDAWSIKRANIETGTRLWATSYADRIAVAEGTQPIRNADGNVLTGTDALSAREALAVELKRLIDADRDRYSVAHITIPVGLSEIRMEASQQATEWLVSAAERKSNWVVNGIDEVYTPSQSATPDQENALKTIEVERQKGVRAIQRATAKNAIQTAYDTAKAAIDNVTVTNAPIWKLDNGSTIPLTDGRHVIPYTEAGGSVTYRADNPVIDAEDAVSMGDVSIDKDNAPEPLRFTYQPASGTIAASYGVTMTYGGTKHPPMGNYDVEITARNACGPSVLRVRFVVPDYQPAFPKPALPPVSFVRADVRGFNVTGRVLFDEATGGNGRLHYTLLPRDILYSSPETREVGLRGVEPSPQTHTITATDEDGDTATQTVLITFT